MALELVSAESVEPTPARPPSSEPDCASCEASAWATCATVAPELPLITLVSVIPAREPITVSSWAGDSAELEPKVDATLSSVLMTPELVVSPARPSTIVPIELRPPAAVELPGSSEESAESWESALVAFELLTAESSEPRPAGAQDGLSSTPTAWVSAAVTPLEGQQVVERADCRAERC